jgi:hypothetical protein
MRHIPKKFVNYDKDLPFDEFAELVWPFIEWANVKYVSEVFAKKFWRMPILSEKIDFDTACSLIDDIDWLQGWPLRVPTFLKRWKLISRKKLKDISMWENIVIDLFPFDYYNRKLECISKMCNDGKHSNFKIFQMKDPYKLFIIEESKYYWNTTFSYQWWNYHLDEPREHLNLFHGFLFETAKLDEKDLEDFEEGIKECDKFNEIINEIITHKDEFVSSKDGRKSNINALVKDIKSGYSNVVESKTVCKKCWRNLFSVSYETTGINFSYYNVLICPHCKIEYWIDPEYWLTSVTI